MYYKNELRINNEGRVNIPLRNGQIAELPIMTTEFLDNCTLSFTIFSKITPDLFRYCRDKFGDEILIEVCNEIPLSKILITEHVPINEDSISYNVNRALGVTTNKIYTYPVREYKEGGWERSVDKPCISIVVPTKYPKWTGKLFNKCLKKKFPWMEKFHMSTFSIYSYEDYEKIDKDFMYLYIPEFADKNRNGRDCVYIPRHCLFEHDVQGIIDAHIKYFTGYYLKGGFKKEEGEKYYNEAKEVLETEEFKNFCEYLKGEKQ